MSILTFTKTYNTPHIANPRERDVLQVGHDAQACSLLDLWLNPEKFRSNGTSDNHSLDTLA